MAEVKYGTKCWDAYVVFNITAITTMLLMRIFFFGSEISKRYGDDEITWGRE